ncbi:DUF5675 family protein [Ferrimonas balearica]|uniref:DUF5675 family protein n=1 Tax=Ferrimonas balearica TaxID=44012 RepID=UPI001F3665D5|nr:DUF5675 family protein [Ferrimonas balearica]MBY6093836.1 hypothetical protein [Ferrimonas balearica]
MTTQLSLKRWYFPDWTLGEISLNCDHICYSIERPWKQNAPFISCVPEGRYALGFTESPKFGHSIYLAHPALGVGLTDGLRTNILLHAANKSSELQGCIAPGEKLGWLDGEMAVLTSRKALKHLLEVIQENQINYLTISKQ